MWYGRLGTSQIHFVCEPMGQLSGQPACLKTVARGSVSFGTQQLEIRSLRWQDQLAPFDCLQAREQFSEGKRRQGGTYYSHFLACTEQRPHKIDDPVVARIADQPHALIALGMLEAFLAGSRCGCLISLAVALSLVINQFWWHVLYCGNTHQVAS